MAAMSDEEKGSFRFGGQRARPRKNIAGSTLSGEVYVKPPGSCLSRWPEAGINVEVECCKDCQIYVLDPCERVQISECVGCRIVVGPCIGSLMIFDCTNCKITVAATQIRLRDTQDCDLRVFAPTKECVVIETSKRLRIGGWDVAYPALAAHFAMAQWAPNAHNYCDTVYDFSPPPGGGLNWSAIGADPGGRWCQLNIDSTEGLCGGRVTETRADAPTVPSCECPCASPDGTLFDAPWYSALAAATAATKDAAATKDVAATKDAAATAAAAPNEAAAKQSQQTRQMAKEAPGRGHGGLFQRLLCWLMRLVGISQQRAISADATDVKVRIEGKQTQVCIVS